MLQVRQLVKTVLPFHAMGFKNHRAVPAGAAPGLKVLEGCARVLLQTIYLEGYSLGLEVQVEVASQTRVRPDEYRLGTHLSKQKHNRVD